jgi:hypothetical protein
MNTVIQTLLRRSTRYRERRFIEAAHTIAATRFPGGVLFSAKANMPEGMIDDAVAGLKNYFLAYAHTQFAARAHRRVHLAMPTAGVDALWHAFVLDTRAYAAFCEKAFGNMLHHVPAAQTTQDSRYDWRARTLHAQAHTLTHVQAARLDLAALAPRTLKSFGDVGTLFVATAYVTPEFPYTFGLDELYLTISPIGAKKANQQADGATHGGGSSPTCFGHCGDSPSSSGCSTNGAGWGSSDSSSWGSGDSGSAGGDGGGSSGCGGGGGCGS